MLTCLHGKGNWKDGQGKLKEKVRRGAVLPAMLVGISAWSTQVTCVLAGWLESTVMYLWEWKSIIKECGFLAQGFRSNCLLRMRLSVSVVGFFLPL